LGILTLLGGFHAVPEFFGIRGPGRRALDGHRERPDDFLADLPPAVVVPLAGASVVKT